MVAGLASCISPQQYPNEPHIEFSRYSVAQGVDQQPLSVYLNFTDGDGDIGVSDDVEPGKSYSFCNPPDSGMISDAAYSIFFRNTKDSFCLTPYKLPYISPQGKYKSLKGEIELKLTASCKIQCQSSPCTDSARYQIVMRDRAGHVSNTIITPPILITGCQWIRIRS